MESNKMYVRVTAWITSGIAVLMLGLFGMLAISGDHDAQTNKAQYVAAVTACGHASDVSCCIALVNNAQSGN